MCEILEPGEYFKVKRPEMTWDKIGGYKEVKDRLEEFVSLPLKHSSVFEKAGLTPRTGILIWGVPKTGFNTFAEAAANSANASYISAKGSELIKNEHAVEHLYENAANLAPCVVFIGELELLAPRREAIELGITIAQPSTTRLFFGEIDRVASLGNVITVGATNRPDILDPALLRSGRLDRKIFVNAPDYYDRLEILRLSIDKLRLAEDVTVEKLAEITENYASADLVSLPREATVLAIRELGGKFNKVHLRHFEQAMKRIPPSLTPGLIEKYGAIYREECKHRYMY